MTALEILEEMVDGSNGGLDKCHKHPNASTTNMQLASILKTYLRATQAAIIEIHKGNVK